jgi:hypothetical protein
MHTHAGIRLGFLLLTAKPYARSNSKPNLCTVVDVL